MKPSFLALPIALAGLTTTSNAHPAPTKTHHTTTIWQPTVGLTWQVLLSHPLAPPPFTPEVDIFTIDLFDNPKTTITTLHTLHRKAICYFSAGTYESWRPDKSKFHTNSTATNKIKTIGSPLDDWPGESWVDLRAREIRDIMASRLDLAVEKGCDGVDPDNIDAYDNEGGGLGLTKADSVEFMIWLAEEAHSRGLAIGLKNAKEIIAGVIGDMQWSVNEQCAEFEECEEYAAFIKAGQPVFHVEYLKGNGGSDEVEVDVGVRELEEACEAPGSRGFSTVIKNVDLDEWVQGC
ncbi:glycoside hydrolase superfamily [Aspergillus karnatakaensis]|uniref:endo alpha-1,4 polygalactosaminidase n=1 Tax=Aspergillus karnatakaensis TaxID=1810916 RepID=UPI003CCCC195